MTEEGLAYIEKELELKLPDEYRKIMGSAAAQPFGGWFCGLFNSSIMVVERTLQLRELAKSYGIELGAGLFVVSVVNGGDSLLLDAHDSGGTIHLWNHETLELERFDSLGHFAEACRDIT